jgi:ABC-2 type transport system ATP-binding protein
MIRVVDLQKSYNGRRVLGPVDFEVARGETLGILGRNGAGKTTLLRILAGDLRPSAGDVRVDGVDAIREPHVARARIGYLPETPPLYDDMRVADFLAFAARLRRVPAADVPARRESAMRVTQLESVRDTLIRHLSYGYRQRVGVAQAIIHDPPILILDEPTHDLDPVQIVEMRTLIQSLKGRHTVIISSHILPEIRETCDRLLVIADGRVIASGTERELTGRFAARRLRVTVRPSGEPAAAETAAADCIRGVDGVTEAAVSDREDGAVVYTVTATGDCRAALCRALVVAGHDVLGLERAERELESVFIELVGEADRARG